ATRLAGLADRAWATSMAAEPLNATLLGERDWDGRLADNTPAGRAAVLDGFAEVSALTAAVPVDGLDQAERTTRAALLGFVRTEVALQIPGYADWSVDPMLGPAVSLPGAGEVQPVGTEEERDRALARWRAMAGYLDQYGRNLSAARTDGRVAAAVLVRKVIAQIEDLLAEPVAGSPLLAPARAAGPGAFAAALETEVTERVRPAYARLRDLLAGSVLPAARPDDKAGICHLPGGAELYRLTIQGFVTLDLSPEEVHETGLRAVADSDRELTELGRQLLGTADLAATLQRLRTGDGLRFADAAEILAAARAAVDRAEAVVPDWFGLRHPGPCEVRAVPRHEEQNAPFAYYQWPAVDGSRPGIYYVNTFQPQTRSRYESVCTACHEAVPGHHLQISIAQRLAGLPAFRRLAPVPAYAEGWGLYAETLGEEMGLYDELDRLGARSNDALRSCRLVVDTGLHAFGWTRQQAIDFVGAHSAIGPERAANEVDRYLAWPGQALSYKLGQLELLRLRAEARARPGFDIRRFHDAVLGAGSLPLAALREVLSPA
ncbi:MAG TPA: DUF885 domain-containing protein, partial [Mycobacteriales bacterium]|nr:DUF885 domain-containing protein [Mycobacteriales bacterium]